MVEVPLDLEVVGDEPDRADEDALDSPRLQRVEMVEDVRAEPRLAGLRLALEAEAPVGEAGALRHEAAGLQELVLVRVALGEDPLGEAVRGEDDVRVGAAHAVREQLDEAGLVVPALDEAQLGAAGERLLDLVAVARDRERASSAARARARRSSSAPAASARSAASAIRGVQCFIPVKTGSPSSASSAARVSSVIAFSGLERSIPSRR